MSQRLTEEQKKKAIEAYAKHGTLNKAGEVAGVSRITLWREMKRNKAFKEAMENAKQEYVEGLENLLDERIRDGDDKASAILLMFKLKAERPDKYRETISHKVDADIKVISAVPRPPDRKEPDSPEETDSKQ